MLITHKEEVQDWISGLVKSTGLLNPLPSGQNPSIPGPAMVTGHAAADARMLGVQL